MGLIHFTRMDVRGNVEMKLIQVEFHLQNPETEEKSSHTVTLTVEDVEDILKRGVPALEDAVQKMKNLDT